MLYTSLCRAVQWRPLSISKLTRRGILTDNTFFKVDPEVRDAVMGGRPVVALETTIYTHGFPYPENIALSDLLEQTVRDNGAIPATIGVLNGVIRVGMSKAESKELLESSRKPTTIKLSRRDLNYICGSGHTGTLLNGGTTIASTMVLAHLAGIQVFATGGLGGVHRGGENSMDISADLTELGRTPVAVISSGCKSFLDIQRTLEYLETQGAGVATFADGRSGPVNFPAFWTRDSGIKSPKTIKDENEAAAIIYAQSKLNIGSGLFFASPIPEEYSLPKEVIDATIAEAIAEAHKQGASGSDNTPFILDYIHRVTKGGSINANRKLIENNVVRGTKVAVALANFAKGDEYAESFRSAALENPDEPASGMILAPESALDNANQPEIAAKSYLPPKIVVAGSLAVDLACDYAPIAGDGISPALNTSNPAVITQSLGGVGHNVATAIHYAGVSVRLCAPLGDDLAGKAALSDLRSRGFDLNGLKTIRHGSTPQYVAVNTREKNLVLAMADMRLLEGDDRMFEEFWHAIGLDTKNPPEWLVIDANWSPQLIERWRQVSTGKIAFEPVSVEKSTRLFSKKWLEKEDRRAGSHKLVDLATPNQFELETMVNQIGRQEPRPAFLTQWHSSIEDLLSARFDPELVRVAMNAVDLLTAIPCIITKLGARGVLLVELVQDNDDRFKDSEHADRILIKKPANDERADQQAYSGVYIRYYTVPQTFRADDIVSVNGVGDTFLGVLLAASVRTSQPLYELVEIAQKAAGLTLQDTAAVSPKIKEMFG